MLKRWTVIALIILCVPAIAAAQCAGVPTEWGHSYGLNVFGTTTARRTTAESMRLIPGAFSGAVLDLVRPNDGSGHMDCVVGGKTYCVEVFDLQSPQAGLVLTSDITTADGAQEPKGAYHFGFWKAFLVSDCANFTEKQAYTRIVTIDGTVNEAVSKRNWTLDGDLKPTQVQGIGFDSSAGLAVDSPGTFVFVAVAGTPFQNVVLEWKARTYLYCGVARDPDPVAVVEWAFTETLTAVVQAGQAPKVVASTAGISTTIVCAGPAAYHRDLAILEGAEARYDAEQREKKEPGKQ